MAKTPTCPYCGAEMTLTGGEWDYVYICPDCIATSPQARTQKIALEKALRRASPWHSVKDGLPEHGKVCVVYGHSGYGADWYDIARKTRDGWEFYGMHRFEIGRWMELPDAPKEVEHNEDT